MVITFNRHLTICYSFSKIARACTSIATILATTTVILISGCATPDQQVGLTDLSARPAEKALLTGIRAYEEAQYTESEKSLSLSLSLGFRVRKDAALAQKYLAFIYCTTERLDACKQAFRSARAADPAFELSKSEIGHPIWGPVYKQVVAE